MQTQTYTTTINAPISKVWNTMLNHPTYEKWTEAFNAGSTYEGTWEKGSEIRFVGPNEEGKKEGMLSRIKDNRLHQFISIEHIGMIRNGEVDTTSEEVKNWAPSYENYSFNETDGKTEVKIDIQVPEEYKAMFDEMWPRALSKLKEICEH